MFLANLPENLSVAYIMAFLFKSLNNKKNVCPGGEAASLLQRLHPEEGRSVCSQDHRQGAGSARTLFARH